MQLKAGSRLRSVVCATEVMVIQAPDGNLDLCCGGGAMIAIGEEPSGDATLDPAAKGGTQIGKRYVNASGDLELLCTKPGEGSLTAAGAALALKEAKPLPSSD